MNLPKLLQGFFGRPHGWLLPGLLLATGGFTVHAQTSASRPGAVLLNLVAVDSAGKPVPDLTASEFAIFDHGSPQQIVSLRLNRSDRPRPLVLLFDLMNSSESSRGAVWNAIRTSLAHLPSTGPLYLYLLVEDGSLYPVHALPGASAAQGVADAAWLKDSGPLLDAAMRKVSQGRPLEFRAASPTSSQARFHATYRALDDMRALMAAAPGPKELLWVTYGIPSTIQLADRIWFDGVPLLRQLGARFVRSETTVYTADPGINPELGILSRDSLDILTGATGGRAFSTIELNRAINRIDAEARTNYSIEYRPPAQNWDGKYHKLRVTVARKGVRLQTEVGYYAVSGS
jgi:VWFA-related protein